MKLVVPLTMPSTRRDPVAGQRLAQRPQDRDRAGDGGLEVEVAAGLLGGGEQRGAVLGEQRLVGGDHRRAVLERGEDQRRGPARCRRSPRRPGRRRRGVTSACGVGGEQLARARRRRAAASGRRTATPTSSIGAPTRAVRSSACSCSSRTTWLPTDAAAEQGEPAAAVGGLSPRHPLRSCHWASSVDHPAARTLSADVGAQQVVLGLAADDDRARPVARPRPPAAGAAWL